MKIAEEMQAHAGVKISKRMIDDWTAPSKRARFPAFLIESFCKATGNTQLQRFGMDERSLELLDFSEALLKLDWDESLLKLGSDIDRLRRQVLELKGKVQRRAGQPRKR